MKMKVYISNIVHKIKKKIKKGHIKNKQDEV